MTEVFGEDQSSIFFKKDNLVDCSHHHKAYDIVNEHDEHFKVHNRFSELETEEDKKLARKNLGIYDINAKWGIIDGDISKQKDLLDLIDKAIIKNTDCIYTIKTKEDFDVLPENIKKGALCYVENENQYYKYKEPEWELLVVATKGDNAITLYITTDKGNIIRNGKGSITLTAHLISGGKDITNKVERLQFSWIKTGGSPELDAGWNRTHKNIGNVLLINETDIYKQALFSCVFEGDIPNNI